MFKDIQLSPLSSNDKPKTSLNKKVEYLKGYMRGHRKLPSSWIYTKYLKYPLSESKGRVSLKVRLNNCI